VAWRFFGRWLGEGWLSQTSRITHVLCVTFIHILYHHITLSDSNAGNGKKPRIPIVQHPASLPDLRCPEQRSRDFSGSLASLASLCAAICSGWFGLWRFQCETSHVLVALRILLGILKKLIELLVPILILDNDASFLLEL
jgi:hypothetical protein